MRRTTILDILSRILKYLLRFYPHNFHACHKSNLMPKIRYDRYDIKEKINTKNKKIHKVRDVSAVHCSIIFRKFSIFYCFVRLLFVVLSDLVASSIHPYPWAQQWQHRSSANNNKQEADKPLSLNINYISYNEGVVFQFFLLKRRNYIEDLCSQTLCRFVVFQFDVYRIIMLCALSAQFVAIAIMVAHLQKKKKKKKVKLMSRKGKKMFCLQFKHFKKG